MRSPYLGCAHVCMHTLLCYLGLQVMHGACPTGLAFGRHATTHTMDNQAMANMLVQTMALLRFTNSV